MDEQTQSIVIRGKTTVAGSSQTYHDNSLLNNEKTFQIRHASTQTDVHVGIHLPFTLPFDKCCIKTGSASTSEF